MTSYLPMDCPSTSPLAQKCLMIFVAMTGLRPKAGGEVVRLKGSEMDGG